MAALRTEGFLISEGTRIMTTENESERSPLSPAAAPLHVLAPPPALPPGVRVGGKRLASAIVIGILFLVGSVFEVIGLVVPSTDPPLLLWINRVDCIIFAIILAVMGVGLLSMKPWARAGAIKAIVVRFILIIVLSLVELNFTPAQPAFTSDSVRFTVYAVITAITALYYGILIFFLTRPGVKAAFDESV